MYRYTHIHIYVYIHCKSVSLSLSLPGMGEMAASGPSPPCAHAHPRSLAGLRLPLSVFTERLSCTWNKCFSPLYGAQYQDSHCLGVFFSRRSIFPLCWVHAHRQCFH